MRLSRDAGQSGDINLLATERHYSAVYHLFELYATILPFARVIFLNDKYGRPLWSLACYSREDMSKCESPILMKFAIDVAFEKIFDMDFFFCRQLLKLSPVCVGDRNVFCEISPLKM